MTVKNFITNSGLETTGIQGASIMPSLNLDFVNSETLDPRITFTRNSSATRVNSAGYIETVSANIPRIDYDPITGACNGLFIEDSRANVLTYSEQFDNAAWSKSNITVSANVTTAPDGTWDADVITGNSGTSVKYIYYSIGTTTVGTYTTSVFVKYLSEQFVVIRINDNTGANGGRVRVNLLTGALDLTTADGTSTGVTATIVQVGNGWYRVSLTCTFVSALTVIQCAGVYLTGYTSTTSTGSVYVWGAQLEAGSFATSYIPSTVTWTGRTSTATYTGSDGLIKTAASGVARYQYNPLNLSIPPFLLVESSATNLLTYSEQFENAARTKANSVIQTNLLTYSEQFDNAAWIKFGTVTVSPNAVTAPNGTLTAETITMGSSSGIYQPRTSTTATTYTISIYIRGDTAQTVRLVSNTDLSEVSSITVSVTTAWQRVSLVKTTTTGTIISLQLDTSSTGAPFQAWGAQIVQGATPGDYQVTTTAALPVSYFAPDGSLTADKLIENSAAASEHLLFASRTGSNETVTFSAYIKAAERTQVYLGFSNFLNYTATALFNLSSGTVSITTASNLDYTNISGAIYDVGNGWYRCSVTATKAAVNTVNNIVIALVSGSISFYTGDGTSGVYVWGAQLETGAYATSYIPTAAATVTRAADTSTSAQTTRAVESAVMTGTNFSSWYNQTKGTFTCLASRTLTSTGVVNYPGIFYVDDGTVNNCIGVVFNDAGNYVGAEAYIAGVYQWSMTMVNSPVGGTYYNTSIGYSLNNYAAVTNNGTLQPATSGGIPTVNMLRLGSLRGGNSRLNGCIKHFAFYPMRLTNAELTILSQQ